MVLGFFASLAGLLQCGHLLVDYFQNQNAVTDQSTGPGGSLLPTRTDHVEELATPERSRTNSRPGVANSPSFPRVPRWLQESRDQKKKVADLKYRMTGSFRKKSNHRHGHQKDKPKLSDEEQYWDELTSNVTSSGNPFNEGDRVCCTQTWSYPNGCIAEVGDRGEVWDAMLDKGDIHVRWDKYPDDGRTTFYIKPDALKLDTGYHMRRIIKLEERDLQRYNVKLMRIGDEVRKPGISGHSRTNSRSRRSGSPSRETRKQSPQKRPSDREGRGPSYDSNYDPCSRAMRFKEARQTLLSDSDKAEWELV